MLMSSFTMEQLPDEPIIICTFTPEWRTDRDLGVLIEQSKALFDLMDEPVYFIVDFRQVKLGLGDVLPGASAVARGSTTMLHHPNMREFVGVTTDKLITMSVLGLNSEIFGYVRTSVYTNEEAALEAIRMKLRA
jgi:hypothetical protein